MYKLYLCCANVLNFLALWRNCGINAHARAVVLKALLKLLYEYFKSFYFLKALLRLFCPGPMYDMSCTVVKEPRGGTHRFIYGGTVGPPVFKLLYEYSFLRLFIDKKKYPWQTLEKGRGDP